ncbi:hypothetical protein BDZ94DRAFT_1254846 [Collybia nuda]|uniref:Bromo domain-containing protein n=1 Tax=Collybia nuda TaxID=64659 RepID=A0A9P5YCA0_9AGAR|nr:hypothetical protein BDZ94DRAFT_1254846 [Collybia nuda]
MNNLLRTLTESRVRSAYPDTDLKLLLTTVKEGRRLSYDAKLSDPFYDSLEGLLVDLRTVTIDNRDAEAFLKPVSKSEVQDYYDVIANPMDFQTMLKKVKQKQYKSKREFKDDLELIWSNCYTYNAAENHPLRPCVKRLKLKADRLLKYITDRKERTDPVIPSDLTASRTSRPRINGNGQVNGHSHSHLHDRSPSFSTTSKAGTPTIKPSTPLPFKNLTPRRDVPFPDSPAIFRTPEGMAKFFQLDAEVSQKAGPSNLSNSRNGTSTLLERLQELSPLMVLDDESEHEGSQSPDAMVVDGVLGDKRKLNGFADHRPRKRARYSTQYPTPLAFEKDNVSELWWGAVQSDALLANGLPHIPYSSSSPPPITHPPEQKLTLKPKRRKKPSKDQPKSLLFMMNNNIRTMKRVRHTHAKFAALNLTSTNNDDPEGGGGAGGENSAFGNGFVQGGGVQDDEGIGVLDDKVDERPWGVQIKGKRRVKGIELGEASADDCMRWMSTKVLEHAGFQGTADSALGVLAGVASEYLLNVGRTIKFLCDRYSNTMTPEEIILHTLFESGTSKIQDIERYISDDVERYGARLTELEKKLVSAYRESTAVEVLEDGGLFDSEDEEEAGALAIGDFADALGEDYLGLRELGIAAEFGMSSLSIPKKLLKGKKGQNKFSSATAKPLEPPPPYPPPPPFIPLKSSKVEDQIGLLKPFYQSRVANINSLAAAPYRFSLPGPSMNFYPQASAPLYSVVPYPPTVQEVKPPPDVIILDDQPNPAQMKMGPLGQILKGGASGGGSKKKKAAVAAGGGMGTDVTTAPKKKKGMTGVGTGNGRKKKLPDTQPLTLPGPVLASPVIAEPVKSQPSPPVMSGQ